MEAAVKRPLSITIISWMYIVAGLAGIVGGAIVFAMEDVLGLLFVWQVGSGLFVMFVGWFMLTGARWSRLVICFGGPIAILVVIAISAWTSEPTSAQVPAAAVVWAVYVFFLTREDASAFFGGPVFRD